MSQKIVYCDLNWEKSKKLKTGSGILIQIRNHVVVKEASDWN